MRAQKGSICSTPVSLRREEAQQRFWDTLAGMATPIQARGWEGLLEVPRGARVSDLDRLRKGPVTASGKSMVAALDRVAEIAGLGLGSIDLGREPIVDALRTFA
jgi:hypothetical protein